MSLLRSPERCREKNLQIQITDGKEAGFEEQVCLDQWGQSIGGLQDARGNVQCAQEERDIDRKGGLRVIV